MLIREIAREYSRNELKFWLHPESGKWINHDIDTHHVKIVAKQHAKMGVPVDQIIHNPYVKGSPSRFGNPDKDESLWDRETADNDDTVSFAAMRQGWVRGGHYVQIERYFDYGEIEHDGGIYLQGMSMPLLRKAVRLVVERYPEIEFFQIDLHDENGKRQQSFELHADHIEPFARRGIVPR